MDAINELQTLQSKISNILRGIPSGRADSRKRLIGAIDKINSAIGELRHFELGS